MRPSHDFHELTDAKRTEWGALWVLGIAIIVLGFWPRLLLDFIDLATTANLHGPGVIP